MNLQKLIDRIKSVKRYELRNLVRYGMIDPVEYYIFKDRKLIYIVNPKAACTSIKSIIAKSYNFQPERNFDLHLRRNWQAEIASFDWNMGKLDDAYKDYFKFTFVRNPLDRLYSCFQNKVLGIGEEVPLEYFTRRLFDLSKYREFDQFVDRVSKLPDYLSDRHFRSQFSLFEGNKIDFIGKMENIEEDWNFIAKKFDFETLPNKNKSERHKSIQFSPTLVRKIHRKYAKDYELLDYTN